MKAICFMVLLTALLLLAPHVNAQNAEESLKKGKEALQL
jgi:hypothetical protein